MGIRKCHTGRCVASPGTADKIAQNPSSYEYYVISPGMRHCIDAAKVVCFRATMISLLSLVVDQKGYGGEHGSWTVCVEAVVDCHCLPLLLSE